MFDKLGYKVTTKIYANKEKKKMYVLKDKSEAVALSDAEEAKKLAEEATKRASKRKEEDVAVQKGLKEKLLEALKDESNTKQKLVLVNGSYVTKDVEPSIQTKVTVTRTMPHSLGEAEIKVESFIGNAIFMPENNQKDKGIISSLFSMCTLLKGLDDVGDDGGGGAAAGAGAGAGGGKADAGAAVNADFFKHLLEWNEVKRDGGISIHKRSTDCMAKLLALAVNTGRHAAPQPTGLAVKAMPFQLQTISFMADAEKHGANAKLWSKFTTSSGTSFYYSAPLNRFSQTPPTPVRGGILASEMGLGKTIMSLGLLSTNPAPPLAKLNVLRATAKVSSRGRRAGRWWSAPCRWLGSGWKKRNQS